MFQYSDRTVRPDKKQWSWILYWLLGSPHVEIPLCCEPGFSTPSRGVAWSKRERETEGNRRAVGRQRPYWAVCRNARDWNVTSLQGSFPHISSIYSCQNKRSHHCSFL